ncbi:hypothetical protein DPMN_143603 [Dreissena polymorpha]|uniref:Uncharacterized protein n=1 Tax=Dreissena polymorpha TaxID=45954 RepID=A0A9D4GGK8_DREPO|nr:hypothetical protein DPMN_143603 [Dreissena polymorpha]
MLQERRGLARNDTCYWQADWPRFTGLSALYRHQDAGTECYIAGSQSDCRMQSQLL